jgi:hypothetical protein
MIQFEPDVPAVGNVVDGSHQRRTNSGPVRAQRVKRLVDLPGSLGLSLPQLG